MTYKQKRQGTSDIIVVQYLCIKVELVSMTMAKPYGLLCSICCHDNHSLASELSE